MNWAWPKSRYYYCSLADVPVLDVLDAVDTRANRFEMIFVLSEHLQITHYDYAVLTI